MSQMEPITFLLVDLTSLSRAKIEREKLDFNLICFQKYKFCYTTHAKLIH